MPFSLKNDFEHIKSLATSLPLTIAVLLSQGSPQTFQYYTPCTTFVLDKTIEEGGDIWTTDRKKIRTFHFTQHYIWDFIHHPLFCCKIILKAALWCLCSEQVLRKLVQKLKWCMLMSNFLPLWGLAEVMTSRQLGQKQTQKHFFFNFLPPSSVKLWATLRVCGEDIWHRGWCMQLV